MLRSKINVLTLVILACLVVVSGATAKPVTLRIALRAEDQKTIDQYKELAAQFMSANPEITVQVENYALNEFNDKMQVQMASGAAPDLFYIHYSMFPYYASQNAFLRLGKYFERDHFDMKSFFPSTVQQVTWKGGSDYAVPRETSSQAFFYNTDMFDLAGLVYPNEKTTYNDVNAMGKALTKDTNGDGTPEQWGIYAPTAWNLRNNIMWCFGGDQLSPDYSEFTMNKPQAVAGLQWIADSINVHRFATTAWGSRFAVQKSAMQFGGFWEIVGFATAQAKFGWDVTYLPLGPAGRFTRTATGAHAIWAGTPNPDAAWTLMKFLSSKESQLALAKQGTIMPALRAAALSPQFMEGPPKNRRVFIDSIAQFGRIDQVTTQFDAINAAINSALTPVWSGTKAVQTAMEEVKPVVDELLRKAIR